jgi:hypothetical protein
VGRIILILACLSFLSCEKDKDDPSDGEIVYFQGYSERDIIFYVGGELQDPSELDMGRLLDWPEISWISTDRYEGNYYFFMEDSVDFYQSIAGSADRYGYFFSNDSLFLVRNDPWLGVSITTFTGIGDQSTLRKKHCLVYARRHLENGTVDGGTSFNVSDYFTIEDLPQNFTEFTDIDQMGPNDTLILYNQTMLYR